MCHKHIFLWCFFWEDSPVQWGHIMNGSRRDGFVIQFFPTCQVRVVRFYQRAVLLLLLRLLTRRLLLAVQIPVGTAGPPPRAPDPSGHCRTSTASSRSQWALPDLNRDFQIAVGTAGPQLRLPDRSGHCRTSTGRMWEKMSDRMS